MHTLIIGASTNPDRASFSAIQRLVAAGHPVTALGIRAGEVAGVTIRTDRPELDDVDTVTLYLNATNQADWYDYILSLRPRRIIFNPGTENPAFFRKAQMEGIEVENACTLVLLAMGAY